MSIPITCVDDFYKDPDKIREWALSLEYPLSSDHYPGVRTNCLSEINPDFHNRFCNKLMTLFFDFRKGTQLSWKISTHFQKIYSYEYDFGHNYCDFNDVNSGWIHEDDNVVFAGLIYLNPNPNSSSGTSIFKKIKEVDSNLNFSSLHAKSNFYSGKDVDIDEYLQIKRKQESCYEISLDVKNAYNRFICYNGNYPHKESSFLMDSEFRFTQVFFVEMIDSDIPPPSNRCKDLVPDNP